MKNRKVRYSDYQKLSARRRSRTSLVWNLAHVGWLLVLFYSLFFTAGGAA